MFEYSLKISELCYKIISDFQIKNIEKTNFEKFIVKKSKSEIKFEYIGIENEDLKLPKLTTKEISTISNYFNPHYIGRGILVIPPLVRHNEDISELMSKRKSKFDVPLLQSEKVRLTVLSLVANAANILLLVHLFSITIIDFKKSKVQIFYLQNRLKIMNNDNLENGIRRLFAVFLPKYNRVMLHSSGIIRNNQALLFFAPDEGGKTTAIKNASEGLFLSDDRNILHWNKNIVIAHSTPWGSLGAVPAKAKVGGLFLLKKSSEFKLKNLKTADILQFIWNEHIHNWNFLPKFSRIAAFNILYNICNSIPAYEMSFPKDHVDWNAIDRIAANINKIR